MRNLKRALSLALASVMLLGMMVVGTSAASFPDVDSSNNVEAIEVLKAVGAMKGDGNGNFNPDGTFTRNEMAAITARLLMGEDAESENYVRTHTFTDVPDWADKYVSICYDKNIVQGTNEEGTLFNGEGTVTAQEVAVMMLRALGYKNITDTGADWAKRAVDEARKISLFKDVDGSATATLTRNDVAQLVLNTLKSDMVETKTTISVDATSPSGFKNEYTYTSIPAGDETNYAGDDGDGKDTVQLLEYLYDGKLTFGKAADGETDTDDLGRPAKFWVYDEEDVYTAVNSPKYSIVVNASGKKLADWAEKANKKLSVAGGVEPTANGISTFDASENDLNIGDVVEFYDVDKDEASTVIVTRYTVGKITEVRECDPDVKKEKDAMEDGAAYVVEIDTDLAGTKVEYFDTKIAGYGSDYVEDAYIAYVEGKDDDLIASYIPKTVDGKVTATAMDDDYIRVDGKKYTINEDVEVTANNEYTFVLDTKGYIIGAEETVAEDVALDEVWYAVAVYETEGSGKYSSDFTVGIQAVSMDGTVKEFDLFRTAESVVSKDADPEPTAGTYFDTSTVEAGGVFVTLEENDDTKGLWDAALAYIAEPENDGPTSTISDDYKISEALDVDDETKIKANDTRIGKTGENDVNVRVNGDTKYIIVESAGDDLKVYQATGGISRTTATAAEADADAGTPAVHSDKFYAIYETVKGNDIALYVVVVVDKWESDTESSDVYYVDAGAKYETIKIKSSSYYVIEVYDLDGKTVELTAKTAPDADGNTNVGFVTVNKIEDKEGTDVYTFKAVTAPTISGDAYEDEKGVAKGDTFVSVYGTELNLAGEKLQDIEAADAKIIDLHDTKADNGYSKTIKSLEGLYTASKAKWDITLDVYLDDGAKLIVVTDVEPAEDEGEASGSFTEGEQQTDQAITVKGTAAALTNVAWTSQTGVDTSDLNTKTIIVTLGSTEYTVTFTTSEVEDDDNTKVKVASGTDTNFKDVLDAAVAAIQAQADAAAATAAEGTETYTKYTAIALTATDNSAITAGTATTQTFTWTTGE